MVVTRNPKAWLADTHHLAVATAADTTQRSTIGILAFECATTMSRLVSLHHSLSEPSLRLLRSYIMRSPGMAYLTSTDQHFLFRLVFSDILSDLDSAAAAVSRLSSRCRSRQDFPLTYANLKSGRIPFTHSSSKRVSRRVKQMEKNIVLVAKLLEEMEILDNMAKKKPPAHPSFEAELKSQKKKVARIKEESLWNKTFDEVVSLMSRAIIAIFTRICVVFGPFVNDLPPVIVNGDRFSFSPFSSKCRIYPRLTGRQHVSGPMERSPPKEVALRSSCPILGRGREADQLKIINTVGRAGLATRYANVVLTAERLLRMRCGEEEAGEGEEAAARDEIYRQLPVNLQRMVKGKLMERWRERGLADWELAKGWKEAVERILRWLGPVARDTVTLQEEKTLDRRRRLDTKPRVLTIQTLEFSDKDKTEAAIVEVLVGISCMFWYDGRTAEATVARRGGDRGR